MGTLQNLKATVVTVKGAIELSLAQTAGFFCIKLKSPAGTTARVGIPQSSDREKIKLKVYGHAVNLRDGQLGKGVNLLSEDGRYIWLGVKPGAWLFEAKTE